MALSLIATSVPLYPTLVQIGRVPVFEEVKLIVLPKQMGLGVADADAVQESVCTKFIPRLLPPVPS